jgi:hypothetical protein|nr:hypothetical protein [uncultured Undibacterium sp.]
MKLYTESRERELEEQGTIQIHIRIRPKRLAVIVLVLLLHGLLLFFLLKMRADIQNGKPVGGPMVFVMDKIAQLKKGEPTPKKAAAKAPPKSSNKAVSRPVNPDAIVERTQEPVKPVKVEEPLPDMASMINAARERRQQSEATAAAENQAAQQGQRGQSPQEIAEANVKRSMQRASGQDGTSGVFQIISKSVRMGTFSFRGWKVNSNGWKQTIEVDAGLNGNIDLAMVRKMIEIIRTHYKGDFRWESNRLGRVVNLSARVEDSAELEAFMLEEFPEFAKPKR